VIFGENRPKQSRKSIITVDLTVKLDLDLDFDLGRFSFFLFLLLLGCRTLYYSSLE